jgi:hypothetical protein
MTGLNWPRGWVEVYDIYIYIYMIYLTTIGLTPGGSETVNIYTQYTEYRDGAYITLKN